ncbi:hypothetical protein K431DRAFT_311408 [Polychaeton citri CBS 116435]|uniref:ABC transporter domain-containing protein n=1 Tax=Polychaeton citri CBS 116435 TaxID=1314669 RepID=A0A9P4URV7_9PEZI|nr:hypothetical protein K431DRAFT_311408 [Polychaeton citri CBS 116435]
MASSEQELNTPPETNPTVQRGYSFNATSSASESTTLRAKSTNDRLYLDEEGKELAEDIKIPDHEPNANERRGSIHPDDAGILTRLASQMSRSRSLYAGPDGDRTDLQRADTIEGMELDDPRLDPNDPKFDLHAYIRMTLRILDNEGIKVERAGVVFKGINVSGSGSALNLQSTVGSFLTSPLRIEELLNFRKTSHKRILQDFDGLMRQGELLIVLGRPGSGCSTLLKTITGEMHGLDLDSGSMHYNGIPQQQMMKEFKGDVIYNQEVDKHFPHLTVGETLEHAAALRMPSQRPLGISRKEMVKHITQVVMAVYGLSHTYNTKVGNDVVRGVSGGERKRVSIAEMALAGSLIGAWDNSTRGLDSATALTFTQSLRQTASIVGTSHAVAIYQASQAIYDLFDKAVVLYEGRQIYFGPASRAKSYFENMGWYCPPRQTTGDFLTSVTNPGERKPREGFEDKVPRTPDEFANYWRSSTEYQDLQRDIEAYEEEYPHGNQHRLDALRSTKRSQQANHTRPKSPYVISIPMQVKLNTKRAFQRALNDKPSTISPIVGQCFIAIIIGSIFFNTPSATAGFQSFGSVLFFSILLNALSAVTEINNLYVQRPVVEKHKSYAFYHPATEAMAGIVLDIPLKFFQAILFNIPLYFMSGLRREPSQFFIFFLINFMAIFVMSALFRTMAALTKTISQAMSFAGILILAITIYTGFVVPVSYMGDWFGWIRWINPVFYAFEILVAVQFHGYEFICSQFVPMYPDMQGDTFICASRGAVAGGRTVNGDDYIATAYNYYYSHVWRNFGILWAFLIGFMTIYFIATELNSSTTSTAEFLVFRRGHVPSYLLDNKTSTDEENLGSEKAPEAAENGVQEESVNVIPPQTDVFTWRDVVYDIEIKGQPRRLLDHVSGWVKPGTLTALMGTSGAGKTTLLDVLAQRTTMGVITGDMLVNGRPFDASFQRKTGYVQQQDLHLETATVRESLRFSAMLRQPKSVSKQEKYDYVEDVIRMLGMEDFAEAVVGIPGEGLNIEQRKLLTIGVELAAKPKLLLFLDEPTSGLDSQSAWSICAFLRKLANNGQAVLCTIHQPSAILFEQFDRLLFLRRGGQTIYFGDIGKNSRTLLDYFESNGARGCGAAENPAEYMLEIAGDKNVDWHEKWKSSSEAEAIQTGLDRIHEERANVPSTDNDASSQAEFAMPFGAQLQEVTVRVFQQYWRMPSYIFAKFVLSTVSGLFIGFSFYDADVSQQGMQNVLYSMFMVTTIFSTIVQQIMPQFVTQRSLYEVRERPSKAYSWKAFMCANIVVEWPYMIISGILVFATFYYPVVGVQSSERQGLVLICCIVLFIYASSFAHLCIAAMPDAMTAGTVVTLLFAMALIFNGVMQSPEALPGFWIFMYRVSPFTYWVGAMAAAMLAGREVQCATNELNIFNPPSGETCQSYLASYLAQAPGVLENPDATTACRYCGITSADQFLAGVNIYWSERWRNFGLVWAYVGFNVVVAVFVYWFFRVRKAGGKKSFSLGTWINATLDSLRASYKQKANVNRGNAEVY